MKPGFDPKAILERWEFLVSIGLLVGATLAGAWVKFSEKRLGKKIDSVREQVEPPRVDLESSGHSPVTLRAVIDGQTEQLKFVRSSLDSLATHENQTRHDIANIRQRTDEICAEMDEMSDRVAAVDAAVKVLMPVLSRVETAEKKIEDIEQFLVKRMEFAPRHTLRA